MMLEAIYETSQNMILILEYMGGGTLLKHVVKKKKLPEKESAIIISKILDSVGYLHNLNIAHRDLKLENIFCEDESNEVSVKLGDFDLATYIDKIDYTKQCGTPGYIAPEVFYPHLKYNEKCDVFSAGVILYIL